MAGAGRSYSPPAFPGLPRQRSLAAAFTPCGGGGDLPTIRLGGKVWYHDGDDEGEFGGGYVPAAARPDAGLLFIRAFWRRIVGGSRKVLSRSGSSVKEQYGHEEYAQNFDDGDAAVEPEYLPRSFSARYARRRPAGPEL